MRNFLNKDGATYLIAEIGVNHNGDVDLAIEMVKAAKEAGADAVKFQTFSADRLVTANTPKVRYQESTTSSNESHYEMIRKLEFKFSDHEPVIDFCKENDIDFISTPYDVESARYLYDLGVDKFKVASADIVDKFLNEYLASTGKQVILATGMASMCEIERAVETYKNYGNSNICLLHCVSNYPCSDLSLNLRVIETLSRVFNLPVGFSDHSIGDAAAMISVALGGVVIEKHFTLDRNMDGPDHKASSTPDEFASLVNSVRKVELILGSPEKRCQDEERQMSMVSRKSIVAKKPIKKGQLISLDDLTVKRPGTGLCSYDVNLVLGKTAIKNIDIDELISLGDLK
jgi:N,N'-diacetyllegionaminate synthase